MAGLPFALAVVSVEMVVPWLRMLSRQRGHRRIYHADRIAGAGYGAAFIRP
jgi:hypothetical protein